MTARKKVIQGSTSSGKTYGIIPILINECIQRDGIKVTVVAETIKAVKDGALDIFKKVMQSDNIDEWDEECYIANPMEFRFYNGSRMQFTSFDTVGKAKASGKRDILFLNEANHISYEIADTLMVRSKETYMDYNPDNEFWAHTEVLKEPNSEFLLLTYEDNEALPPETLEDLLIKRAKAYYNPEGNLNDEKNIKSKYWANWWRVYGLGMTGRREGLVLEDWETVPEIPSSARLQGYGIDFGFSNSPFAMVAIYKMDGSYYFDEVVYSTGLTNQTASRMALDKGINTNAQCYADSAEPKSIHEMQLEGINVMACDSKQDIRTYALKKLQGSTFYVSESSKNIITELEHYKWAKDKNGQPTGKPIKDYDHAIDAIIYFIGTDDKYSGEY